MKIQTCRFHVTRHAAHKPGEDERGEQLCCATLRHTHHPRPQRIYVSCFKSSVNGHQLSPPEQSS